MAKAPRPAPAPSPGLPPRKSPAPSPGSSRGREGFRLARKINEDLAKTLRQLDEAKQDALTAERRANGTDEALTSVMEQRDEMAEVLEPYGAQLRTALRQAEGALHRLARMTACGVVNAINGPLAGEQQIAFARLRDTAHNGLRFVRAAQEDARKHDLIPSV